MKKAIKSKKAKNPVEAPATEPYHGRARSAVMRLPIYDTIALCAGATGIPEAVIKKAKRAGSSAFQAGGRINLGELLRWLFSEDAAGGDSLDRNQEQAKLARANTVAQELENLENSERLHDKSRVEDLVWENAVAPIRAMVINLKKVTGRQVDAELEKARVEQGVRDDIQSIINRAVDGGLETIRGGFKK